MKGVLTHALAGWEHLTKELQILRTQMALRHENATMNATEDQSKPLNMPCSLPDAILHCQIV